MLPEHGHTVRSFDAQLQKLGNLIVAMGSIARSQIEDAARATRTHDADLASQVLRRDKDIDEIERQVDVEALHLFATRQLK